MRIRHQEPRNPVLASTQQPMDVFKPFHDRQVKVRSVPCPTCGAGIEEFCLSANGRVTNHPMRRRMAIRAEFAAKENNG